MARCSGARAIGDAGGGDVVIEGWLHGEVAMRRDTTARDGTTARGVTRGGTGVYMVVMYDESGRSTASESTVTRVGTRKTRN